MIDMLKLFPFLVCIIPLYTCASILEHVGMHCSRTKESVSIYDTYNIVLTSNNYWISTSRQC